MSESKGALNHQPPHENELLGDLNKSETDSQINHCK
jgi:hypothetical protein